MRTSLFMLGILALVGGAAAFVFSASRLGELTTLWGSVQQILSSDAAGEYQLYSTLHQVGPVVAVLGLVLCALGLVMGGSRPQYPPQYYSPPPSSAPQQYVCPYCSHQLIFVNQYGRWFCPNCQRYL